MTPIIEGLDGVQKMSKSLGNAIGVTDSPFDMFTKLMTLPDALIGRYYTLLTDLLPAEISTIEASIASGTLHPMQAKRDLARTITAGFHTPEQAAHAEQNWSRQFQQGGVSDDIEEIAIAHASIAGQEANTIRIPRLLVHLALCASNTESHPQTRRRSRQNRGRNPQRPHPDHPASPRHPDHPPRQTRQTSPHIP